jgi:ubiquinone/menaquinone biosynthesis C-methylase UbiE
VAQGPRKITKGQWHVSHPVLSVEEIWRKYDADEARLSAPLSRRMLALANVQSGMRVLDLATGRGEPAIGAAHLVGNMGVVVGIDASESMLQMARERALAESIHNLTLIHSQAELIQQIPNSPFDAVLCRWGLMYMTNPVAALRVAAQHMKPGAVLVAALWAEPERVNYFSLPRNALKASDAPAEVDAQSPHTFRFANPKIIERDFGLAGFEISKIEELSVDVMEAKNGRELIEWVLAFGMAKLTDALSDEQRSQWKNDVVQKAQAFRTGQFFRLGGVTRIVVAQKAGGM